MQETWVQSLGWEDLLEKGTAAHSSILVFYWRIPRIVQFMGLQSQTQLSDFHLIHNNTYICADYWLTPNIHSSLLLLLCGRPLILLIHFHLIHFHWIPLIHFHLNHWIGQIQAWWFHSPDFLLFQAWAWNLILADVRWGLVGAGVLVCGSGKVIPPSLMGRLGRNVCLLPWKSYLYILPGTAEITLWPWEGTSPKPWEWLTKNIESIWIMSHESRVSQRELVVGNHHQTFSPKQQYLE